MAGDAMTLPAGSSLIASQRYLRELDGMRALAVSLVVAAHYGLGFVVPGAFGVTLFFFLSGYLITTLFYAEYQATDRLDIVRFYMRRWLRLTPPLTALVLAGCFFYHESRVSLGGSPVPAGTILAAMLYYTNYWDLFCGLHPAQVIPFGICWSLAVEEHFYALWPWLLRRLIGRPDRLCMVLGALCAGVLLWRTVALTVLHFSTDYTYMASDCRVDSILYGALLRVVFETAWAERLLRVLLAPATRVIALVALLTTFAIRDETFRQTLRYTIQGLALAPLFTAVLCDDPASAIRRALASPPMVLIGRLSYSIYLFHLIARTPGEAYFGSPYHAGSVISGILVTLAIAYAMLTLVEQPMAKLRHRLRAGSTITAPGALRDHAVPTAGFMALTALFSGDRYRAG
jgi:peptidoglycan/LPS O-acetylase OafA/YrhL